MWDELNGNKNSVKCPVDRCQNEITMGTCHMGHNKPESLGGRTCKENLLPICWQCNLQMGNRFTILEWSAHLGSQIKREHINLCAECHEPTGKSSDNQLVMCDTPNCTRSYCLECLGKSEKELPHKWYCGQCHIPLPFNLQIKKGVFYITRAKTDGEYVM